MINLKKIVSTFALTLLVGQPALAQSSSGIYSRSPNSTVTSPTPGQTWNFQGSDGAGYKYSAINTWDQITLPKVNASGSGAPGTSDDNTQGYAVGSEWFDLVGNQIYVCSNAATSAAVWSQFSNITGGGGSISGSISANQVAVGSGTNAIGGSSALTFASNILTVPSITMPGSSSGSFNITPAAVAGTVTIIPPTTSPLSGQIDIGQGGNALAFKTVTGDWTINNTGLAQLATVNVSPGVYTNSTVTVNAKGLCTSVVSGTAPGTGTVTSVAMTGDGTLFNSSVTGSPITTSGTLAPSLINAPGLSIFGNYTGSSAAPAYQTGAIPYAMGGTNASSKAAFQVNASPMATLGDTIYEDGTPKPAVLPGNITTAPTFYVQTGTGSVSASPVWTTLSSGGPTIAFTPSSGNIQMDVAQGNLSLGSIGGTLNLATQVTGNLPVANGGSGQTVVCAPLQAVVLSKSGNYTRSATDYIVQYTTGSSALFDTLPAASSSTSGISFTSVKVDSGGGTVTVIPVSGTINGASSYVLNTPFDSVTIYNDGTSWWIR